MHTHTQNIKLHLFDGKKTKKKTNEVSWSESWLRQDAVLCVCVVLAPPLGRRADGAVLHHRDGDGGGEDEEEGCCWVDRREHKQQPFIWI